MWHARTVSPKSGGRKVKAGRRGDNWQHLCTVGPKLADPVETLGIDPDRPLPCWGWGDIPDQRRHSRGAHLEGAGDLLRRPSASAELADTFQQFIIAHSTMIPDTGTPARRVRRDRGTHSAGAQRAQALPRKLGSGSGVTPVTTFSNSQTKPAVR